jgi:hypothetical protein
MTNIEKLFSNIVLEEIANGTNKKQVSETLESYERYTKTRNNYDQELFNQTKIIVNKYTKEEIPKNICEPKTRMPDYFQQVAINKGQTIYPKNSGRNPRYNENIFSRSLRVDPTGKIK